LMLKRVRGHALRPGTVVTKPEVIGAKAAKQGVPRVANRTHFKKVLLSGRLSGVVLGEDGNA
jgi:hypothetical protein